MYEFVTAEKRYVVQYSGGVGSWLTAYLLRRDFPDSEITLLFADTMIEDEDLHRFIEESTPHIANARYVRLADGRTPWQVFRDEKFIGNTRVDLCSRILKRKKCLQFVKDNYDPSNTVIVVGIDWTEEHRLINIINVWYPYEIYAPLVRYTKDRDDAFAILDKLGITKPRLYTMGFSHNNCGGFCIKAGQGQFVRLLKTMPERFAQHEAEEQEMRDLLGKDVAIMRETVGGKVKPLTMKELRRRVESQGEEACDTNDIGGCNCGPW